MSASSKGANQLLSLMSSDDRDALAADGDVVSLVKGVDLARAGDRIEYCWFPLSGMASIIASDTDDHEAEVGVIGNEGMVNSGALLGSRQSAMRILVQIGGSALRVNVRTVLTVGGQSSGCFGLLTAFHQSLEIQAAYSALAYAQYPIVKRLARWILMCADRVNGEHIDLTHEALSIMLGVRRAGVTVALKTLEQAGAIAMQRGMLSIAHRTTLLGIAGGGYGPAEAEYRQLVGQRPGNWM